METPLFFQVKLYEVKVALRESGVKMIFPGWAGWREGRAAVAGRAGMPEIPYKLDMRDSGTL